MHTRLISITPEAEATLIYIARVSSDRQDNPEIERLIRYCINHQHWSVFEHASATFEIVTSRAIATQILRHRSFCFQEFSQRYASPTGYVLNEGRRPAEKNRQSSVEPLEDTAQQTWESLQRILWENACKAYQTALDMGVSRECARMVLPLGTQTRMYMTGNIRSWIHYLNVRDTEHTQHEHRLIAQEIKRQLAEKLPLIASALWNTQPLS